MIGGNDHSASRGYILKSVELDVPEQTAEKANNGSEHFERPLRKLTSARRRSWAVFLNRICSVTTQMIQARDFRCILQRPFPIDELDVNSRHAIRAGAS